jgi:hypothetical protein
MDRRPVALVAGFWMVLAAPVVHAQVLVLQNDAYTNPPPLICVAGFAQDETMAARFTAPAITYPYTVERIRVLACGGQALYQVTIWQDTGALTPGTVLWQSDDLYTMGSPNAFYDVVPPNPIVVTSGTVRVGLSQFLAISGTPGFGRDQDGITSQRNLIQDNTGTWIYAENIPIAGDFVLRLHVTPSDVIFEDGFEA